MLVDIQTTDKDLETKPLKTKADDGEEKVVQNLLDFSPIVSVSPSSTTIAPDDPTPTSNLSKIASKKPQLASLKNVPNPSIISNTNLSGSVVKESPVSTRQTVKKSDSKSKLSTIKENVQPTSDCLLYTSDAADE